MKHVRMTRPPVPEHPLRRQIAEALRLEIAPHGKASRDGVVWWSVDHAAYAGTAPSARVGRGIDDGPTHPRQAGIRSGDAITRCPSVCT